MCRISLGKLYKTLKISTLSAGLFFALLKKDKQKEEVSKMEAVQKMVNGVNVEQLFSTVNFIKKKPEIAQFKFRAMNQWIDGTHNRATVREFYGALKEDTSREPMVFEIDEPPILCGSNLGANPVEYLLVALSG